jgi:putative sigma-54 modulation protein
VRDRTMQITIRGHHLTITPAIEENIRLRFAQMIKHLDQVNSMQVKLSKDHQIDKITKKGSDNHIAEAIIRLPGIEMFAQASADDMYAAIKKLTEKLKRQLHKYRKMQIGSQPVLA